MTKVTKALIDQARKLAPAERLELVDGILSTLETSDAELDRRWVREAEDRLAAYHRGELKAIPLEAVLAKYRGQ